MDAIRTEPDTLGPKHLLVLKAVATHDGLREAAYPTVTPQLAAWGYIELRQARDASEGERAWFLTWRGLRFKIRHWPGLSPS